MEEEEGDGNDLNLFQVKMKSEVHHPDRVEMEWETGMRTATNLVKAIVDPQDTRIENDKYVRGHMIVHPNHHRVNQVHHKDKDTVHPHLAALIQHMAHLHLLNSLHSRPVRRKTTLRPEECLPSQDPDHLSHLPHKVSHRQPTIILHLNKALEHLRLARLLDNTVERHYRQIMGKISMAVSSLSGG